MIPIMQKIIDAKVPMNLNPPAMPQAIAQFDESKKVRTYISFVQPKPLPDDYKAFLQYANGGTLFTVGRAVGRALGPKFYGIGSPHDSWSLAKLNSERYDNRNNSLYLVGYASWHDDICVDMESGKYVTWNGNTEKVVRSWDSLQDYLEEELQIYLKRKDHISPTIQRFLAIDYNMGGDPPADEQAIAKFEQKRGVVIPPSYREMLLFANGSWFAEFNGPEPEFYGLKELGSKGSPANRAKYNLPDSLFLIGATTKGYATDEFGSPSLLCIDLNTQELVQWQRKQKNEFKRWPSIDAYLDEAYEYYIKMKKDAAKVFVPQTTCRIQDMLSNQEAWYILFANEGELAGQCIRITRDDTYVAGYRNTKYAHEQVAPASYGDMIANRNIHVLRKISIDEWGMLYHAMKAYCGIAFTKYLDVSNRFFSARPDVPYELLWVR